MRQLWVFGYGSLVNPATHSFSEHVPATLYGWRRQWRHWVNGPTRFATSLTAEPDPTTNIHGLLARVPEAEWDALDEREKGYDRITIPGDRINHNDPADITVITYQSRVPRDGNNDFPILQSYLDVVLKGFCDHYGDAGLQHFLNTTDGWGAPINRDRARPIYPRAVTLPPSDEAKFDDMLTAHGARWID